MKSGDVSGVRTSSQESWLSTPLSDPNAALWASITPPANPTLETLIRRRARAFSLDLLAHRLHLRFPEYFSSRSRAFAAMVGSALTLSAGVGALGYFLLVEPNADSATEQDLAGEVSSPEEVQASADLPSTPAARNATTTTSLVRLGETAVESVTPNRAVILGAQAAPDALERRVLSLSPPPLAERITPPAASKAEASKAKRAAWKKKARGGARRAAKIRRAMIASE
jgi:hypothetical protein